MNDNTLKKPAADSSKDVAKLDSPPNRQKMVRKLLILLIAIALFVVAYVSLSEYLTLEYLSSQEAKLHQFKEAYPLLVLAIAFLIYVTVTGFSLPGAGGLTLACGWSFGFWQAVLLVSFASTTGATIAFLLSRYLFHDAVQNRFGDRLERFNEALKREGAFYLFTLRLIPVVPFFVINVVMGMTQMRVRTFWWVSQLGMLAGTSVYVYAGAQFPSLRELAAKGVGGILTPQIIIAFVLLGLFPIVIKRIISSIRVPMPKMAQ